MTLGVLLCGSLVCFFLLNGSTGLPVKQGHRNGQTADAHNPVIDEDLYWDPTKVWQHVPHSLGTPEAHGPNIWGYSGLVGPRSIKNAAHNVDQQSSSDVALSGSGNQDQNGGQNPLVFERVFQFHPEVSAVLNYMPFSGAQTEYLSDTWWHNFLRDDD